MAPPNAKADPGRELAAAKGKINALSAVLRLGHEAFQKTTLAEWSAQVVNNSVLLLPYNRSELIDLRGSKPKLLAVSGLSEVKNDTEFAQSWRELARYFAKQEKPVILTEALLDSQDAPAAVREAFVSVGEQAAAIVLVPLRLPQALPGSNLMLWAVELGEVETANAAVALLSLLSEHYNESLHYLLTAHRHTALASALDRKRWFRPSRLFFLALFVFIIACFVVRVPLQVSSEFEIVPAKDAVVYSPFDGIIGNCNFRSGDTVKAGDVVLQFNTEERNFNLIAARSEYDRTGALLDLTQRQAFTDPAKRSQVRLLDLQRRRTGVELDRNRWFIERSTLRATADGTLEIGDATKLEGKAVRAGERLFEVLRTDQLDALIALDERNASVLTGDGSAEVGGMPVEITLYLHARPEVPITAKIVSVSPRPILTERKLYCYMIRVEPANTEKLELRDGMRGIAKISGETVSLGYYLFRNLILRYRQW